jgi:hypothetical protein
MKANELRIGNWYTSVKFEVPVYCELSDLHELCVRSDGAYNDPPIDSMFEPIPLTEEWLLKFGFEREDNLNWWNVPKESNYKAHHLMEMQNAWTWFIDFDDTGDNTHLVSGFNYVHQLQNLYFALTGNELEIK